MTNSKLGARRTLGVDVIEGFVPSDNDYRHCSIMCHTWPQKLDTLKSVERLLPTWDLSDFGEYVQKELTPFVRRHVHTCYFVRVSTKNMICVLMLDNGFTVMGESGCINPEHYDPEIGAKYALHVAVDKASPIIAYGEQEKLFRGEIATYDAPAPKE
jgi:hypothetical protein